MGDWGIFGSNMKKGLTIVILLNLLVYIPCIVSGLETYRQDFSLSLAISDGILTAQEPGYDMLFHNNFSFDLGLYIGNPWAFSIHTGYSNINNSSLSPLWYRYRGFSTLDALLGIRYKGLQVFGLKALTVELAGGGSIATYYYSDSYFFYPNVALSVWATPFLSFKNLELNLGCKVPVYFRKDISNYGISILMNMQWYPVKRKL